MQSHDIPRIWHDMHDNRTPKMKPKIKNFSSKLMVIRTRCSIPWYCYIIMGVVMTIVSITTTVIIAYVAPRPSLYGESCAQKQCVSGLGLKCSNTICTCSFNQYYSGGCKDKIAYMQPCYGNSDYCSDNTQLACVDGVCKCNETRYWNGIICNDKSTFNQVCSSHLQCRRDLMLMCNFTLSKCLCPSNRYIY